MRQPQFTALLDQSFSDEDEDVDPLNPNGLLYCDAEYEMPIENDQNPIENVQNSTENNVLSATTNQLDELCIQLGIGQPDNHIFNENSCSNDTETSGYNSENTL